jgi:L-threonylcarbamoyladenylate synthase
VLLRPGMLGLAALQAVLGNTPLRLREQQQDAPSVSGDLPAHYQPDTPVRIISNIANNMGDILNTDNSMRAYLTITPAPKSAAPQPFFRQLSNVPARYAQELYATLRLLDSMGFDEIVIEAPPDTTDWMALHDRLKRAAYRPV